MDGQPPAGPWQDPWSSPGGAYRPPGPSQSPYPPAGHPAQPAMERPTVLTVAVALMYLGAAFWAFSLFLTVAYEDELVETVAEDFPELSDQEVEQVQDRNQTNVPSNLVAIGLWIWMAIMNSQGKSWARITGTVFAGLNVAITALGFGMLAALGVTLPPVFWAPAVFGVVLSAVIVILMFQRPASDYYNVMSRKPVPTYGYGSYGGGYRSY